VAARLKTARTKFEYWEITALGNLRLDQLDPAIFTGGMMAPRICKQETCPLETRGATQGLLL
jgi:hypothetical protein